MVDVINEALNEIIRLQNDLIARRTLMLEVARQHRALFGVDLTEEFGLGDIEHDLSDTEDDLSDTEDDLTDIELEEEPPAPIMAIPSLRQLSNDSENVHTGFVNQQTNTNMKILLETPVPNGQNTIKEITTAIMKKRKPYQYVADIENWYERSEVCEKNDYLIKRLLDGLWARIKASEHKTELIKRLREELREMYEKCAQGHISRICNVMVGFDEEMKPVVSIGEQIQNRMSLISQKEIPNEEKVMEALQFFAELGNVTVEEQNVWIDAL